MIINKIAVSFVTIITLMLLTGCIIEHPYSEDTSTAFVDKRITGNWVLSKKCQMTLELNEENDYILNIEQGGDFIGSRMFFKTLAKGNLFKYKKHTIGQFKVKKCFTLNQQGELSPMVGMKGRYIIGVIQEITDDSFVFLWINSEMAYKYKRAELTKEDVPAFIEAYVESDVFKKRNPKKSTFQRVKEVLFEVTP